MKTRMNRLFQNAGKRAAIIGSLAFYAIGACMFAQSLWAPAASMVSLATVLSLWVEPLAE